MQRLVRVAGVRSRDHVKYERERDHAAVGKLHTLCEFRVEGPGYGGGYQVEEGLLLPLLLPCRVMIKGTSRRWGPVVVD